MTRTMPSDEGELPLPTHFFVVRTEFGVWYVSTVMARSIERALESWPPRTWIAFVDIFGSRVRLRRQVVKVIEQSTDEQRGLERRFQGALRREYGSDCDWSE